MEGLVFLFTFLPEFKNEFILPGVFFSGKVFNYEFNFLNWHRTILFL